MNTIKMLALATLMSLSSTWAVAQDTPPDASRQDIQSVDREGGMDWGWVGLLGLAGLMGLKRRDRNEDVVRTANRPI